MIICCNGCGNSRSNPPTGLPLLTVIISLEYANLLSEIDRIAENTQWNGKTILNHTTTASSTFKYQVGTNDDQTIAVDFGDMTNSGSGVFAALATGSHATIVATTTASALTTGSSAVGLIDSAITSVNSQRAPGAAVISLLCSG